MQSGTASKDSRFAWGLSAILKKTHALARMGGKRTYIRDKRNDNPALTPPMIARLVGDKRWDAVKDIPGRSRVKALGAGNI
jgi:hypothetical protein